MFAEHRFHCKLGKDEKLSGKITCYWNIMIGAGIRRHVYHRRERGTPPPPKKKRYLKKKIKKSKRKISENMKMNITLNRRKNESYYGKIRLWWVSMGIHHTGLPRAPLPHPSHLVETPPLWIRFWIRH